MDLTYYKKPAAFVAANPDCTFEEFEKATGCGRQSWYDGRHKAKNSGHPVTRRAIKETTKFILANPNATFEEFKEKFGDDQREYVQSRARAKSYMELRGIKNLIVPFRAKKVSVKAKKAEKQKAAKPVTPSADKKRLNNFVTTNADKDRLNNFYESVGVNETEVVSQGITPQFVWYESTLIRNDFQQAMARFERLVRVMDDRQADNNRVLAQVVDDNRRLRADNKALTALLDAHTKPGT